MPVRGAAIPWPATPLTPSLSSEHLSTTVYHRLDSFHFSVSLVMLHKPAKPFGCTLPAFNTSRDLGCSLLCSDNSFHLSSWCLLVSCCITFKDQPEAFGLEPKLQHVALPRIW